jgi:hypothetical protein
LKKLILPLLLAVSFLFAGFEKANAVNTVVSITSLGVTGGPTNGLAANPISTAQTGIAIGGFTLSGSATGTTVRTVSVINFVTAFSTPQFNNYYFSTVSLYSSTSSTFMGLGAPQTGATPLATYTMGANYNNIAFTGLNISVTGGTTLYYFMVVNYTGVAAASTFELDYTSSTISGAGGTPAANGTNTGFNYTVNPVPVTAIASSLTTVAGSAGLSTPATISTVGNYTVYGMSLTPSATGTTKALTGLTFTTSGAPSQFNNYFYGTAYLYASNNSSYDGTAVQISTVTTAGNNTLAFTGFTTAQSITAGTTKYYYVVIVYSTGVAATATQTLTLTGTTSTATVTISASAAGPSYTYSPPPYALTLTSLTNVAGNNGLSATPVAYGSTNYSVYGFQLLGGGGAGSTSITSLTFNQNGTSTDFNNLYYTTAYLYSNTTNSYATGTKTLIATTTAIGTNSIVFTPGTAIAATNTTNTYYFIVLSNTLGDANTNTFQLTYASSSTTGTAAITPAVTAPAVTGPAYTFKPVPPTTVTFTSYGSASTTGLVNNPINTYQSGIALYGFTLTGSGTGTTQTVTSLTFETSLATIAVNNEFFPTLTLYSSTNPVFQGVGNGATSAALGSVTLGANYNTFTITPTTALNVTSSTTATVYYFLVANYTTAAASYANPTYEIDYVSSTSGSGAAVTSGTTTTGYNYTFALPAVTAVAASLTTTVGGSGLSAINPISTAGNYAVYGMSLTPSASGSTKTITGLTFTTSGTPAQTDDYFYATAYLYTSTNASYTGATPTLISTINPVPASNTLAFTFTASQNITAGTTGYYYVVIVYSTGVAATANQTITYSSATSTATITPGATIAGPNYTYNVPSGVIAQNVPSADLTSTAIYVGQTNIAVAGIGLSYSTGTTTLTQLKFAFTPNSAATLAQYFSSSTVRIVSTTSAPGSPFNYASTTTLATAAAFTIGAGTITVTIPSATINSTPTYFYLVTDYTVAGGAVPKVFTFTPTSYTTALSGAVTTSYPTNSFTCTAPTYYWTGAAGDNNWQNANNWEVTTTAPLIVTSYYPGQIYSVLGYTSTTPDNVDIAPSATPNTINVNANLTLNTIYFENGRTTNLNVGSTYTLAPDYITIGNTTSGSAPAVVNLGGGGTLSIAENQFIDPSINYNSTLNVNSGGNLYLGNLSELDILGTTGNLAKLTLATGGNITAYNSEFYLAGDGASITASGGTLSATNDTYLHLASTNESVINNGATIAFDATFEFNTDYNNDAIINNSGTLSVTGASTGTEYGTTTVNGGTFNITASSYTLQGTASAFNVNGGTVNITAASTLYADNGVYTNSTGGITNADNSTINLAVGGTSLVNSGTFYTTGNTLVEWTYKNSILSNTGGSFNATNTTFTLGTVAGSQIANSAGTFNLGSGSVINLSGSKNSVSNSGTGTFTCAPSSVINLTYSTATLANAPTVNNTSSNPFTLLSDHTGSATIGKISTQPVTGALTGKYNVQRYISTDSRNYRVLSSATNVTQAPPGTAGSPNLVDISQLGNSVTSPATYNGAFIGGPGANFSNHIANPLIYLYQESILPGTSENATFTSGKNVGVSDISLGSPYLESTVSTAAGGTNGSDNATLAVKIPAGNAYLLYYIHDNTSTVTTDPLDTAVTTATGYINQGTIPFVLWGAGTLTNLMTKTTTAGALYPGVTMVGNPYPSTIDLQQLYKDNIISGASVFTSGTGEAFYELDPTTEQFVSYNYNGTTGITSGSTASRYIASGQGFYVTVINTGKPMNFQEDQKIPSATSAAVVGVPGTVLEGVRTGSGNVTDNLSRPNRTDAVVYSVNTARNNSKPSTLATDPNTKKRDDTIAIHPVDTKVYTYPKPDSIVTPKADSSKLTGLHLKLVLDSLHFDECGIYFSKKYSDSLDKNDAPDLDGTGGKVYLSSYTSDKVRTSINAMSMFNAAGKRIPLFVKYSASGLYSLGMEDIANFNKHYSVFLIDNLKKDSLDLTLYKSYNFNYTAGTAGDSTRFVLAIEHKPIPHYALVAFAGSKVTPGVKLSWTTLNEGNITTFILQKLGANNTYAYLDSLQSDSTGAYSFVDQHPTLGNNTYRLQQIDGLGNITYSAPVTIGYNSTNPNGGLVLYPNPAKTTMTVTLTTSTTATQVATADIYNAQGKLVEHKVVNSNSFTHDVSGYELGVYIMQLKNSNGDLVGNSKFVKVN